MLWEGLLTGITTIVVTVTIAVALGWIVILWSNRNID
jgi:hypothetical protein